MFGFGNPGQFFGPAEALSAYKNMECSVAGGTAIVSVNKYRNANKASAATGGCQDALVLKDRLRGVAKDAWDRAGGSTAYVDVFVGKGSPWAIAGVLETLAAHADAFAKAYLKSKGTPEGRCAAILANDDLEWEEALQRICNEFIGLDCNGFVGNWLKVVQPDFKLNQNDRADNVRAKAKAYRSNASEIEAWDVMCYTKNEHIAAVNSVSGPPYRFMVCQSAGGGPRMNEFAFIKTGTKTFKLAAPTPSDIGNEFYVISLW
jgi:hypothetical protein